MLFCKMWSAEALGPFCLARKSTKMQGHTCNSRIVMGKLKIRWKVAKKTIAGTFSEQSLTVFI